mgnify:CR=1 FL=1
MNGLCAEEAEGDAGKLARDTARALRREDATHGVVSARCDGVKRRGRGDGQGAGHGDGQTTKYFAINQYNPISTG